MVGERERARIVDISAHRRADISSIRGRAESIGTFYIYQRFTYQPFISETAGGGDSSLYTLWQTHSPPLSLFTSSTFPVPCVFLFLLRLSYVTSNLYVLRAAVCTSFLSLSLSFFSSFKIPFLRRSMRLK